MKSLNLFPTPMRILMVYALFLTALSLIYWAGALAAEEEQEKGDLAVLKKVMPEAERFEAVDKGSLRYQVVYKGEERIGGVFYTEGKGYGGPMQVMVGIDPQGKVVEVILVSHQETLGLWTKQAD